MTRELNSIDQSSLHFLARAPLHYVCGCYVWLLTHPVRPRPVRTPRALGLPYLPVRLLGADGELSGWYLPRKGSRAGLVLCHGFYMNRMQLYPLLRPLHEAGFHLLLFDFHPPRPASRLCTFGLREHIDVLSAVAWLRQSTGVEQVGLYGISMGGASVLLAAAKDPGVEAVATDSAYARLEEVIGWRFLPAPSRLLHPLDHAVRHWVARRHADLIEHVHPEAAVQQWRSRPLFVIHAGEDRLISPEHGHRLAAAGGDQARLWLIPGIQHARGPLCAPRYQEELTDFFRRHLRP